VTDCERQQHGRRLAERYFGDDLPDECPEISVDRAELTGSAAFGAIWTRPALGLRDRACPAVGMTAAIGALPQIEWHTLGSLRSRVAPTEIREAMIQAVRFERLPADGNAMRTVTSTPDAHDAQ
jgi:alkylhydroperoxidase/carboxymuconolactone decarboxylase family protein YurZ